MKELKLRLERSIEKLTEASSNLLGVINSMTIEDFALAKDIEAREELANALDQFASIASDIRTKRPPELKDTRKPRIVIKIEGGVPQEVGSDKPVDLIVLDYDTEGADEDDLIEVDGEQCFLHDYYGLGNEKDWVDQNWVEEK